MTYEHVSGNTYEVTLIVYRDCNTSQTDFDDNASIGIFDENGSLVDVVYFPYPDTQNLGTEVGFDCQDISIDACIIQGTYQGIITLPNSSQGYWIAYQRCCRNPTILNLQEPGEAGNTYSVFVPSSDAVGFNSSPVFNDFPPVGICQDVPLIVDLGATDADGDSLVIEFCTPYSGANSTFPQPDPPLGPPWPQVNWGNGFSANYPVTSDPAFELDIDSGQLTGTPTVMGQYVVGVCVKEYRNGEFISEIRRDFQFNITACPNIVASSFANFDEGEVYCLGTPILFENLSLNGTTYQWDFDNGDLSNDFEPTYTFEEPGVYDVQLIIDAGSECSDTSMVTYLVSESPHPTISAPVLNCPEATYDIQVGGAINNATQYVWSASPAISVPPDTEDFLEGFAFSTSGDYTLQVEAINAEGCGETAVLNFNIPAQPIAVIQPIDDPCLGLGANFINQSQNGVDFFWEFGDPETGDTSTEFSPFYTYSQSGTYDVSLTVTAPETCVSVDEIQVEVNPIVVAEFVVPPVQCLEGNSFDFEAQGVFGDNASIAWTFEGNEVESSTLVDPPAISYAEQGVWPIVLTISEGPCSSTQQSFVETVAEINADFYVDGESCSPYDARFMNLSTGGQEVIYLWEFGDGTEASAATPSHLYETAGVYSVTLTAESTFGCPGVDSITKDTVITVVQRPTASFSLSPAVLSINDPVTEANGSALDADNCTYFIEGQAPIDGCDVTIEFMSGGEYEVTQVARNNEGCESRLTQEIRVLGHSFFAPNAITLNQDGLNDFFKPAVFGQIVEYELVIYDRWGGQLFSTNDLNMPWVPEFAHQGIYLYEVRLRDNYDFRRLYRGHFNLIR